jgi:hypothetical protein
MKFLYTVLTIFAVSLSAENKFQNSAAITFSREDNALIKAEFPQQIYNYLRTDYRDMQIFSQDQKSVEFAVKRAYKVTQIPYYRYQTQSITNLQMTDNELTLDVKFKKSQDVAALRINSPIRNFEFDVTISLPNGKLIANKEKIYDYSDFVKSRKDIVTFAKVNTNSLHVKIAGLNKLQKKELVQINQTDNNRNLSETNQKIMVNNLKPRFTFSIGEKFFNSKHQPQSEQIDDDLINWKAESKEKETVISIDPENYPIETITLQSSDNNFSRNYYFRAFNPNGSSYRTGRSGELSKWHYRSYKSSNLAISAPQIKSPYEVVIVNNEKSPIDIVSIDFTIPTKNIYFLSEPNKSYELKFTDKTYNQTYPGLPSQILNDSSTTISGEIIINQLNNPIGKKAVKESKSYRMIIMIALILIILFLIYAVASTAKHVEKSEL